MTDVKHAAFLPSFYLSSGLCRLRAQSAVECKNLTWYVEVESGLYNYEGKIASDFLLHGQHKSHFVHFIFLWPDIGQEQSWVQAGLMAFMLATFYLLLA